MNNESQWLQKQIIDFISVIYDCLKSTTYAEDRRVYLRDLSTATGWLVRLNRHSAPVKVVEEILAPETDKHFGDYWRQGEPGRKEAEALNALQNTIKERFKEIRSQSQF